MLRNPGVNYPSSINSQKSSRILLFAAASALRPRGILSCSVTGSQGRRSRNLGPFEKLLSIPPSDRHGMTLVTEQRGQTVYPFRLSELLERLSHSGHAGPGLCGTSDSNRLTAGINWSNFGHCQLVDEITTRKPAGESGLHSRYFWH